mmetsp:Transcript_15709/g.45351  ORF Transcript_15709/g.45351 Transcript_15709/m.45351 type:complete len:270 (+) Transcript_15709:517-1326(+)
MSPRHLRADRGPRPKRRRRQQHRGPRCGAAPLRPVVAPAEHLRRLDRCPLQRTPLAAFPRRVLRWRPNPAAAAPRYRGTLPSPKPATAPHREHRWRGGAHGGHPRAPPRSVLATPHRSRASHAHALSARSGRMVARRRRRGMRQSGHCGIARHRRTPRKGAAHPRLPKAMRARTRRREPPHDRRRRNFRRRPPATRPRDSPAATHRRMAVPRQLRWRRQPASVLQAGAAGARRCKASPHRPRRTPPVALCMALYRGTTPAQASAASRRR